jgi:maleate cis-trans isomerase
MSPELEPWYRLGYVTPHAFVDTVPYQFYQLVPRGMMLVMANLDLSDYTAEAVEHELPLFWRHAEALGKRQVDRIALAGVPVAVALGRQRLQALLAEASERTGVPWDSDLEAIIAGLHHLGVERVALATRWHDALNQAVADYLGQAGIETVGAHASAYSLAENERLSMADGMRLAVELGREAFAASPEAQALILPGGLWISIHAIPVLEAEFGKPVVMNLTATLWAALHNSGASRPVEGWGKLLAGG